MKKWKVYDGLIYKSIDLFLTRRSGTLRRSFAQFIITRRGARVLNNPENFEGLSESANCSKGSKSYEDWTEHKKSGTKVDPEYREKMMERETEVGSKLQKQIGDFNNQNSSNE